jgi:tripartite-type tricarboxylate transporter receptor subunit TctC
MVGAALALNSVTPDWVFAQNYPSRQLSFVCAFPAGSGADVLVRYFSEKMSAVLGQTVIVENKPGANGNIAAVYTARAKPDGYTVFVHSGTSVAANTWLFKKPPIDVVKDLRGVQFINKQPFMIVVRADSPIKDIPELTAHLKDRSGAASYATTATAGKVFGESYKQMTGAQATEVSYRTGPDTMNDVTSGHVDFAVLDPVFSLSQARAGRIRILAVSSPTRMQSLPDVPAMKEYGIDIDQLGWWGAFVPAGTPDAQVEKLNAAFQQVLETPETAKFLNGFGGDVYIGTPQEVQALLAETVEKWRDYVAMAKIPQN